MKRWVFPLSKKHCYISIVANKFTNFYFIYIILNFLCNSEEGCSGKNLQILKTKEKKSTRITFFTLSLRSWIVVLAAGPLWDFTLLCQYEICLVNNIIQPGSIRDNYSNYCFSWDVYTIPINYQLLPRGWAEGGWRRQHSPSTPL